MSWKDLGQPYDGQTEALVFESTIKQSRNGYMFAQYKDGNVRQHSVGMWYVVGKMFLCVDSTDKGWEQEKKNWDKYIDYAANRKDVEEHGYFYAITEAKVIEGSAVPLGSNWATPTLDTEVKEPPESTPQEPDKSTLSNDEVIKRINNFKVY